MTVLDVSLVGDDALVPCADGRHRRYLAFDAGASTSALPVVAERVRQFLPQYASVHRGAGYKSQRATDAYEEARQAAVRFARRTDDAIAVICKNTTDAINQLAYRLRLGPADVVLTTVVEHHANLLPWGRYATRRYVECDRTGTFSVDDVVRGLRAAPRPRLLAITGASNVTGWLPPLDDIIAAAHAHGVPVLVDAAQLAPHRPLPAQADFVCWSAHKMYAPFGAGALVGPRQAFEEGDPFVHGGGAVAFVDLDEVAWVDGPEREEAGSPNVVGAVAMHAAMDELDKIGWEAIVDHEEALAERLLGGLAAIPGVSVLGPGREAPTLATAAFVVEGIHHSLMAARLSVEYAVGVRDGCFCAHPYLTRLLGLTPAEVDVLRADVLRNDRRRIPGAVRASAGISTTGDDVDALLDAVAEIASGKPPLVAYVQDTATGSFTSDTY